MTGSRKARRSSTSATVSRRSPARAAAFVSTAPTRSTFPCPWTSLGSSLTAPRDRTTYRGPAPAIPAAPRCSPPARAPPRKSSSAFNHSEGRTPRAAERIPSAATAASRAASVQGNSSPHISRTDRWPASARAHRRPSRRCRARRSSSWLRCWGRRRGSVHGAGQYGHSRRISTPARYGDLKYNAASGGNVRESECCLPCATTGCE